jgi:hypothetical protein
MQMNDEVSRRLGSSLEQLNARIARLAIGLGISLDDQVCVDKLMHQPQIQPVAQERRVARQSSYPAGSMDRRTAHQREELRGLLVLRYHMEATSVNVNGLEMTRQVLRDAQDHLVQRGFKPGADGLQLDDFFNES